MISKQITVTNPLGVHARPSCLIVRTMLQFKSSVTLTKGKDRADAKNIMEVMSLAATFGCILDLVVDGPDENEACKALEEIFRDNFSEGYL